MWSLTPDKKEIEIFFFLSNKWDSWCLAKMIDLPPTPKKCPDTLALGSV